MVRFDIKWPWYNFILAGEHSEKEYIQLSSWTYLTSMFDTTIHYIIIMCKNKHTVWVVPDFILRSSYLLIYQEGIRVSGINDIIQSAL